MTAPLTTTLAVGSLAINAVGSYLLSKPYGISGIVIGTDMVAKAPKDGFTLLYTTVGHAVVKALFDRVPFEPVADFAPIALIGQVPMILMVNRLPGPDPA